MDPDPRPVGLWGRWARRWCAALPLLLCALSSACGNAPAADPTTLTVAVATSPTTLDPRLASDTLSTRLIQLTHRGLVRLDDRLLATPDLATWEFLSPLHLRFHLTPGVTFHDGQRLTAADVVATYQSLLDPALASPHRGVMEAVARVEAVDAHTVDFHLHHPFAPLLASLTLGIVPAGYQGEPPPPGSGPFRLRRWQRDQQLDYARFEGFSGAEVTLPRLTVRILPDATVRALELERGTVDLVLNDLPTELLPRLASRPHLHLLSSPSTNQFYLGLNLHDPLLADVRVRQAIACAIDRTPIIDHLLGGQATPATGLLPADHWAYRRPRDLPAYDPDRARRLLAQARGEGAPPLAIEYKSSTDETARLIAQVIAEQLRQVGIELTLRAFEWGTFYGDIRAGRFQLYCLTWTGVVEPDLYYTILHSHAVGDAGANRNRYTNPVVDGLLEEARTTLDEARRRALYGAVQEIAARDLPAIPLWHPRHFAVVNRRVVGYVLTPNIDLAQLATVRLAP
ncbi:MAG: ABC transporter substrate-binding protein [Deltaproteobacteria bacterium]|nr:ABC transporter substrate-binding protein [Deltaproteobacteria bacterium]NCP95578.1 ABC transporter substrate-binding protein [Deltaproteobacteria bacterium]NCS73319.1 ABC transporter substrate-binding protein [Deltaproteobacteria bacterium]